TASPVTTQKHPLTPWNALRSTLVARPTSQDKGHLGNECRADLLAQNGLLWLLAIADHLRPHCGAVHRALGGPARRRRRVLDREPAAGARTLGRGAERSGRPLRRHHAETLQRAHPGV